MPFGCCDDLERSSRRADSSVLAATTTTILGNIQPKWTGGFINTFRYKGFDLSGQIDARIGGQLYSATNAWGIYAGILASSLPGREDSITVDGVLANGTPAGNGDEATISCPSLRK